MTRSNSPPRACMTNESAAHRRRDGSASARRGIFAGILLLFLLAGCGGPTLYQPADPHNGYREQQIERDRYRVTFAGNSLTDRATVEIYLLYRAAELTLERGFDYFVIADRELEAKTRYYYSFSGFPGYGYYRLYGYSPTHGFGVPADGTARPRTSYEAVADIVMLPGEPAERDVKAFEAREVLHYLKSRVKRAAANKKSTVQ